MENVSKLEQERRLYKPKLPVSLRPGILQATVTKGKATQSVNDQDQIAKLFPHTYGQSELGFEVGTKKSTARALRVGVVLSGGQAPGGHNVISGIFDGINELGLESELIGFLGGPGGLEKGKYKKLDSVIINEYRNTGGFDIIGSGRTKLETNEQFDLCITHIQALSLDAIVIIGGDDSNTNAAILAEYLASKGEKCLVIGVPKTIDGDLKSKSIPTSFGFDTACKVYSELVGNIARDAVSAKKYWHFIKLMGRSASHIALEVGLQTHPNLTLISEEVAHRGQSLKNIVDEICDIITARADASKNYGIVLVPEGLIEFIPSFKTLIGELNDVLAHHEKEVNAKENVSDKIALLKNWLKESSFQVLNSIPESIQTQLLWDRDPHGNVQVSRIDTEMLLIQMVEAELKNRKSGNHYSGSFSWQRHFFGYEGRCAAPSNFDADYCYSLGYSAVTLILHGLNGYMASITNLSQGPDAWKAGGIPITMLMNMEQRHGSQKPVIQKALVELDGPVFHTLSANREQFAKEDSFSYPGPIQYFGPSSVSDQVTFTLAIEGT